jgi:hypothetical protein
MRKQTIKTTKIQTKKEKNKTEKNTQNRNNSKTNKCFALISCFFSGRFGEMPKTHICSS